MEGKMSNCDPDAHVGPPLKKARYQWQVKGQKRLKENDAQLKSSQENDAQLKSSQENDAQLKSSQENDAQLNSSPENDAANSCDSTDGFRGFPAQTVSACPSDVAGQEGLNENNMQAESFMKQAVTHGTKDCEEDLSTISIRSNEVTHGCSVVGYNLSGCSVDISATRLISKSQGISQEMVQDGHKQTVITSTESHMIVPLNKTKDNSCSSVITGCSSSSCLHMEQSCEGKTTKPVSSKIETFSGNSVLKTGDVSSCGSLGNSCYEILEPGTSTGSISVEAHRNVNSPCDKAQDILALESSNTNFMDLIQTKVDIQARKLNLLNMVHTNSRQENLSEDNTATIPMKTHRASPHLSPVTTSDVLSTNNSTANSTDHVTASELPDSAGQDSPESNLDVLNPQEEEETFLSRWQSQHTAKAIVDNAINKTLEEMGLTPDVSTSAWNRLFLEDEGISEAIRFRGLWLRENSLLSGRIHPLISQITGASEQVFEQTLDNAATQLLRPVVRETAERNSSPDEGHHTQAVDSDSLPQIVHSSLVSQKRNLDTTSEVVKLEPSPANPEELDLIDSSDVCEQTACGSDSDGHVEDICSDDPSEPATSAADDVLQFALNAAITSKGLSIRSDQSL
ncbi:uncharacterized protein LOC121381926 [Gigantopelta aegis]|uniref:uncharacterized protein LOC121381926 n=1 Tax=Gigantopelta aegis TaxID=1735272 RepID=UPI001B889C9F|nr:uncharacterized protein LOC121381926 [Gigantopelta aegis]